MKIKTEVELLPFPTPDFVIVKIPPGKIQDGYRGGPTMALHELDDETLDALCEQFKDEVFRKKAMTGPADEVKP